MASRIVSLLLFPLCLLAALISLLYLPIAALRGSGRAWRIILAYDRLGNALTGGHDRETISSRANRKRKEGKRWACVLCRVLHWIDTNHCEKSAEDLPPEIERKS